MRLPHITLDTSFQVSRDCQGFADRWAELRRGALVPAFDTFIDAAPSEHIPSCYILEFKSHGPAMVRFQGTELVDRWQQDLTGTDIHATLTHFARSRSLANM